MLFVNFYLEHPSRDRIANVESFTSAAPRTPQNFLCVVRTYYFTSDRVNELTLTFCVVSCKDTNISCKIEPGVNSNFIVLTAHGWLNFCGCGNTFSKGVKEEASFEFLTVYRRHTTNVQPYCVRWYYHHVLFYQRGLSVRLNCDYYSISNLTTHSSRKCFHPQAGYIYSKNRLYYLSQKQILQNIRQTRSDPRKIPQLCASLNALVPIQLAINVYSSLFLAWHNYWILFVLDLLMFTWRLCESLSCEWVLFENNLLSNDSGTTAKRRFYNHISVLYLAISLATFFIRWVLTLLTLELSIHN